MFAARDLDELLAWETDPESPILSIYLNVDQHDSVNLNRGFETALKSLLRTASEGIDGDLADFQEDCGMALRFVGDYQPAARGLILFCDGSRELQRSWDVQVPTPSLVRWRPVPYVRPLLEARDEYQRYGIILTDRAQARLFTVSQGEIEENRNAFAEADVRQFDGTGSDQIRSQMAFQRRSDEHARQHLREVAQTMSRLWELHSFDRLILAGPTAAVAELKGLLPATLGRAVVGTTSLAIDAPEEAILEETARLHADAEREGERQVVEDLITAAAKQQQAVTGLDGLLAALWESRVRSVVYADGFRPSGGRCRACSRLVPMGSDCPACAGDVDPGRRSS